MRIVSVSISGLLLSLCLSDAHAQDGAKLRATKTFRCSFIASATVDMDGDVPRVTSTRERLDLTFDQIDAAKGSGRMIGNVGGEDVTIIAGAQSVTLVEATPIGIIQVTVIYMAQRSDGEFKAVHSRHTAMMGGVPIPSQMYGSCKALL